MVLLLLLLLLLLLVHCALSLGLQSGSSAMRQVASVYMTCRFDCGPRLKSGVGRFQAGWHEDWLCAGWFWDSTCEPANASGGALLSTQERI
jgi:hypothetical protein